jgi:serine/threonine protein phosphatase 1
MALGGIRFSRPTEPATALGERIYAIGDVHGRLDLLRAMMIRIEQHHLALEPVRQTHLVLLGDLVDRGPDSAAVLRMLYNIQQRAPHLIVLKGNHEDMMLRVLNGEPGMMRQWVKFGGAATLRSYGIEPPTGDADLLPASAAFSEAVPAEIKRWLRSLPLTARSGDYFFCHAGIRPGQSLQSQTSADLLWIREEFLGDPRAHGGIIVHGHSVSPDIEQLPNRIGIDTGAFRTGILSAMYFEGSAREALREVGDPDERWGTTSRYD